MGRLHQYVIYLPLLLPRLLAGLTGSGSNSSGCCVASLLTELLQPPLKTQRCGLPSGWMRAHAWWSWRRKVRRTRPSTRRSSGALHQGCALLSEREQACLAARGPGVIARSSATATAVYSNEWLRRIAANSKQTYILNTC